MSSEKESIDSIWASMNEAMPKRPLIQTHPKDNRHTTKKSKPKLVRKTDEPVKVEETTLEELERLLAPEIRKIHDENANSRKQALQSLHQILFVKCKDTQNDYSALFRDICKPVFTLFGDKNEKCRELSLRLTAELINRSCDVVPVLAYYFPALIQRLPNSMVFDQELQLFINDVEMHEAYKRGKAVIRQDKLPLVSSTTLRVVEPSEDVRYLNCMTLCTLLQRVKQLQATPILHPYFEDIVRFLQAQLGDSNPNIKVLACSMFEDLAVTAEFELGMKFYAVALVRAILPLLRYKHAKVRLGAVRAIHRCFIVPDRAKRKAAGSEALIDLVGFREENVLPVASFYTSDVQVNYLAELSSDPSAAVREQVVLMLTSFLSEIGDRYDHQTRLLPYILDLIVDDVDSVSALALDCLQICGKQYEDEHFEEILEKRQYGVDGDSRINLDKAFPRPFMERPRIGMRLYVRGNTKRFLTALLNELTNWLADTRFKSANLLKVLIVLCEESLTMEINVLLPALVKAIKFARQNKDAPLLSILTEIGELLGRYVLPEIYVFYLIPRLRGDSDLFLGGTEAENRISIMIFLEKLISGSKAVQLIPYLQEIVDAVIDPFAIDYESNFLQHSALNVISTTLTIIHSKGQNVVDTFYDSTGRLDTFNTTITKVLRHCMICSQHEALTNQAVAIIHMLAAIKYSGNLTNLLSTSFPYLLNESLQQCELAVDFCEFISPSTVLITLLECPYGLVYQKKPFMHQLLGFLVAKATQLTTDAFSNGNEDKIANCLYHVFLQFITPITLHFYPCESDNAEFNKLLYGEVRQDLNHSSAATRDGVVAAIHGFTANLVTNFICDNKWNQKPKLIFYRLLLVSLLFGIKFPSWNEFHLTSDEDEGFRVWKVSSQILGFGQSRVATELLPFEVFLEYVELLLAKLVPTALTPSIAVSIRFCTIHVLSELFSLVRENLNLKKLKSFKYWKNHAGGSNLSPSGIQIRSLKEKMQLGLIYTTIAISDSNDQIRALSIQTLCDNLCFILYDEELELEEKRSPSKQINFSSLTKLLLELITSTCSSTQDDHAAELAVLDQGLRLICVLDANQFISIIKEELGRYSQKDRDLNIFQTLNELLSHAELILHLEQFNK